MFRLALAAVLSCLSGPGPAPTAALPAPVAVRVYNTRPLSDHQLAASLRAAGAILAQAGIDIRWMDCAPVGSGFATADDRCAEPPSRHELLLRTALAPTPIGDDRTPLGDAVVDAAGAGVLATVYLDRVTAVARIAGVEREAVLGRAIAHEIGHLLLGSARHETRGVMRGVWSRRMLVSREPKDWQFTARQAAAMRDTVAGRAEGAPATRVAMTTP